MRPELLKQAALAHRDEIMPPYDRIMDLCGFEAIYTFSEMFSGSTIYVPSAKTIFMRCLENEAKHEFNGANYQALSHKYGLSVSHLRKVIGQGR